MLIYKKAKAPQTFVLGNHDFEVADEDKAVVSMIVKFPNVVAYMNGHNHKGNYTTHKGCHFVNFKGMVETEASAPFAIVKYFTDRIEIDGYDTEPDRSLTT